MARSATFPVRPALRALPLCPETVDALRAQRDELLRALVALHAFAFRNVPEGSPIAGVELGRAEDVIVRVTGEHPV